MEQPPSELPLKRSVTSMRRRCLAVVNSAGDIHANKFTWTWTPLQDLTFFTLFCDIFDQVWSLLKYWENVNSDFTINLNFAFAYLTFFFFILFQIK